MIKMLVMGFIFNNKNILIWFSKSLYSQIIQSLLEYCIIFIIRIGVLLYKGSVFGQYNSDLLYTFALWTLFYALEK